MQFPVKITLSYIWVAIPVDWVILHWYTCGTNGRSGGRSDGVRSRDYQIFSDEWFTTFSYPWCSASRASVPLLLGCPFQGCPVINSVFGRLYRKTVPRGIDCEQSLIFFFAKLLHAKPKHASPEKRGCTLVIIMSWFAIALDELRARRILRENCWLQAVYRAPRNPEGVANLKKAICVVRSDSIIGVTLSVVELFV